ncbi:TPA: MucBP domain-containing protein, partial [Streptococcus suis]|nr:MucBP domain-containing protein [Streptococcus suis]
MRKLKKKSFDWYGTRQHFSIRKYHFGAASVLLGMSLALGAGAQAVQAQEAVVSPENTAAATSSTDSSASSEAVVTESTVASSTETASSVAESTETTASSTTEVAKETAATETAATTERAATVSYIVQYVAEDGTVVKADVKSTTVNTTEATAKTNVSVIAEVPAGYEIATGQVATVSQEVTENAVNIVTVKVVKKAEETKATTASETAPSTAATTETKSATPAAPAAATATVAETVKTPATVKEAKVVLEQVTSEAEVLATEAERLVAATDSDNAALKSAAAATKLTATEATAVLNNSTATLEAVNAQIDAVRTNVEALALELRKFLGTDLIQIALTTTSTMENGNGLTGTWTEEGTVTNKEEAVKSATIISATQDFPTGYIGDEADNRVTFMIYSLSNTQADPGLKAEGKTNDGSYNYRSGNDYYIVFSVNKQSSDGDVVYAKLVDKTTNTILDTATLSPNGGQKIFEKYKSEFAKYGFTFTMNLTKTTATDPVAKESISTRNLTVNSGQISEGKGTIIFGTLESDRGQYNILSTPVPTYSPRQSTKYFVKETDKRPESLLASYEQNGDLSGDAFTIAGEATFDNYELVEAPTDTAGTLASDYSVGSVQARYFNQRSNYIGYRSGKAFQFTSESGAGRYFNYLINPDNPDFIANYEKYGRMSETDFIADIESILRISERSQVVKDFEDKVARINKDSTLSDSAKEAAIAAARTEASAALNTTSDDFLITFVSKVIQPKAFNDGKDAITGLSEFEYSSPKYNFRKSINVRDETTGRVSTQTEIVEAFKIALGTFTGNPITPNISNWINDSAGTFGVTDKDGNMLQDSTGRNIEIAGINLSMPNQNLLNDNHKNYYYAEKGSVKVFYVDTEGNELQDPKLVNDHDIKGTDYDTTKVRDKTITTADGTVYHYVYVDTENLHPASDNSTTELRTIEKITQQTGTVETDTLKELTYVYAKAGNVNVNYVDTDGNVIKTKVADVTNGKPDSDYDTVVDNKPSTITAADGTVYHLVPKGDYKVGTVSDNNNLTAVGNGTATGIDPVTGTVVAGETKEITYVYQKAGNVNVNYVDTKGNVIKDKVADEVNEPAGTDYDTVVDNKPEKITTEDGKVYYLAPAATYEVGTVSDNNNLTSVGNGKATGIDPVTGKVVADETKEITYVYQEAGHVNVNYVDTEGNVIKLPVVDVKDGEPGSDYDTVVDNKPAEISYNGNLYRLVPKGTYKVGKVSDNNNLTAAGNGKATGVDPVTGEVVAGETKEITYVYELVTGNVVITYVDTEGNPLKEEVKDTTDEPVGESYSTKEDENEYPSTIEKDGDTYYRVEAGEHKVGKTTEDGHLVSSDDPKGTVEEGTKKVTYVYEKAGNVNINYVDTEGNVIKLPVTDTVNGKAGTAYDTAESSTTKTEKPAEILYDGKLYKLVPAGTYNVGTVGESNNLTAAGNGKATGVDPVTGEVVAGETKEITYVYELVTGNVVITYVDTDGNVLKEEVKDTTDKEPGTPYDTKENDTEYPKTIEKDGETYYRVEAGNHKVGNTTEDGHLVSSDDPKGNVEEGTKTVTYVYEKAGNVNVNYVDTEGNVIKTKVVDVENGKPGSDYDTVVDNKPATITTEDGKVYKLVPAGSYNVGVVGANNNLTEVGNGEATGIDPVTGEVVAGETKEITYVYEKVTGSVVAR